jgi:hypothetical protein
MQLCQCYYSLREIRFYFALNTGHCTIHIHVQKKYMVGIFAECLEVHLFPVRHYSACATACPYYSRVTPILLGYMVTHGRVASILLSLFSLPCVVPCTPLFRKVACIAVVIVYAPSLNFVLSRISSTFTKFIEKKGLNI